MESTKKNRKINLLRLNVMNDIEINSTLEEENHIRHVLQAYNMFMEVSFGFFAASIGSCAHLGTTKF